MFTVETAVIAFVDFNTSNCNRNSYGSCPQRTLLPIPNNIRPGYDWPEVSRVRSNIIWNRWKSTLRARSIWVNLNQGTEMLILCTLLIRPGEILESRSLFTMNEHAIANVHLDLSFLLRIMLVKNILLQISFALKRYKLMWEYFARNWKADVNYFRPIKLVSLRKRAPSHNIVCTGTSSIRMAWTLSLKYLSVKTRLLMKKVEF